MKLVTILMFALFIVFSMQFISAAIDSQKTLGDPSAKLTMEMYTEFQDPFSARWYKETLPQLQKEYISDRELKIVFRHFPLSFHTDSLDRAKAVECAAEQGVFFAFAEKFYNDLSTDTNMEYYRDIANDLRVPFDFNSFKVCFNNSNTKEIINSDMSKGANKGVQGVPTFFVKNEVISGAQQFTEFKRIIDSLLGTTTPNWPEAEDMQKEPVRGDGKVRIIGYMGYNDPFSKRVWITIDRLFEEFDKDEIEFEFRNFPLSFQDQDYKAAQVGECVFSLSNSETFFRYSSLVMSDKEIFQSAVKVGLNKEDVENCLANKKFYPEVLDDLEEGKEDEVQGTPTFFIEGTKISGAQEFNIFVQVIKKELGENNNNIEIPIECEPSKDAPVSGIPTEIEDDKCTSGCQFENVCLQFGQRVEKNRINTYCSFNGDFKEQRKEGESCQNNYECFSNQCSNVKCVDLGKKLGETNILLEKILGWFKRVFGAK